LAIAENDKYIFEGTYRVLARSISFNSLFKSYTTIAFLQMLLLKCVFQLASDYDGGDPII